jgi:protoheme IX farnesyltransferase
MRRIGETITAYFELCKIKVSFFSALSVVPGYLLASSEVGMDILPLLSAVFLLACGSSALNQYQERVIDGAMERTSQRPLPSGRLAPVRALYFSVALILSGLFTLLLQGLFLPASLGLFAVLWYNGLYTFLKRKTPFAIIPGALVGAIPPAIGWISGGGPVNDPRLLVICFFFYLWQVPHFWILLLDYGKEYERAGLPSLSGIFSRRQLKRIILNWIFATVVSGLLVIQYGIIRSIFTAFLLFAVSSAFAWQGRRLLQPYEMSEGEGHALFRGSNYYMLAIIALVSVDRVTYAWMAYGLRSLIGR